jgi:hypothetical protein
VRRLTIILALLVASTACSNAAEVGTTLAQGSDASVDTADDTGEAEAGAVSTTQATTTQPEFTGPTDCLEIWPETVVQAVAGSGFTFFDANATRDACTYWGSASGIALAWRSGDRSDFDIGRISLGAVSDVFDIAACNGGFYAELEGAGIIMEAHSDAQGRTYTATMSGTGIDDGIDWAVALLDTACQ